MKVGRGRRIQGAVKQWTGWMQGGCEVADGGSRCPPHTQVLGMEPPCRQPTPCPALRGLAAWMRGRHSANTSVSISASPKSQQPSYPPRAEPTSWNGAGSVIKSPSLSEAAQDCRGCKEVSWGGWLLPVRDPGTWGVPWRSPVIHHGGPEPRAGGKWTPPSLERRRGHLALKFQALRSGRSEFRPQGCCPCAL